MRDALPLPGGESAHVASSFTRCQARRASSSNFLGSPSITTVGAYPIVTNSAAHASASPPLLPGPANNTTRSFGELRTRRNSAADRPARRIKSTFACFASSVRSCALRSTGSPYVELIQGTSNNSFVGRIVSSRGARNPHVPGRTFRLLRSGLLTLHPQK